MKIKEVRFNKDILFNGALKDKLTDLPGVLIGDMILALQDDQERDILIPLSNVICIVSERSIVKAKR